ncbi:MAG: acyl-CoA dehydrogenase family protein [Sporichthyaceae bacterium]
MTSTAADRAALASAVRACLDKAGGPREFLGDERPAGIDAALWRTLIEQIGLGGLVVPETHGGFGGGYGDLAVGFEALGATLAPVPALASAMATGILLGTEPEPPAAELLSRIAAGARVAVLWPPVHAGGVSAPTVTVGEGVRLTGSTSFVVNGTEAEVLLVPAKRGDTVVLAVVDAAAGGVLRRDMTTLDLTRGMAEIALDGASGRIVGGPGDAADALSVGLDLSLAVIAAEQVGLAQECHDRAVAWAKERIQFDRPIGSFQAIKHRLVDLLLELELARSAKDEAIAAADRHLAERTPGSARELRAAASMAAAMCGEVGVLLARETLHVFGGIGFTWEHDAHLFYRRALANQSVLGDPAAHRVRLAATLGV